MILASIRTPVEIWTRILKYAIEVPIFLDVDPIESYGVAAIQQYHWELPYWSAERHRNSFRRVCSSWNQYLSKFNHRYIRMTDILHGVVPEPAFSHAIRLNLDICGCEACTGWDPISPERTLEPAIQSLSDLLRDLLDTHGPPPGLKIVHAEGYNNEEIPGILRQMKLQSILANGFGLIANTERADLRVVICHRDEAYDLVDKSLPPLQFPSLTTLSIWVDDFTEFTWLRLDALKHLSVSCANAQLESLQESLITMLTMIGSQLETFFWTDEFSNQIMPGAIWSLCPKLLQMQTPYKWDREPPIDHPIRCVRLSFTRGMYWDLSDGLIQKDFKEYLPVSRDGRFEKRGVMLAYHWSQLLLPLRGYILIDFLWEAVDVAANRGIEFVDIDGLYLEEYILTFLVNVWKRVMVRKTYRDMEIYDEPLEF